MTTTNQQRAKIATLSFSGYKAKEQCYAAIRAAYPNTDKAKADTALLAAYADAYKVPKGDRLFTDEGEFAGFAGTKRTDAPKSERMSLIAQACGTQFRRDTGNAFKAKAKSEGNKTTAYHRAVQALVKLGTAEKIRQAAAKAIASL